MKNETIARRGIIVNPADLKGTHWPELAAACGLNVLGLHADYATLCTFTASRPGQQLQRQAAACGLELEFLLHFTPSFLTPELFAQHPDWFSMDTRGVRYHAGANPCTSSPELLDYARSQAAECARHLPVAGHRYELWAADTRAWCHCPACLPYSPAEQNLRLMNALLEGLRTVDRRATVASLAYLETLAAPKHVKPLSGVGLTFAPYQRHRLYPLATPECFSNAQQLRQLDELLAVFPAASARVLEYWLDVSFFSCYRRDQPPANVAASPGLLGQDLSVYALRGIRDVTTFACWMDAAWLRRYGDGAVRAYGAALAAVGSA